MASTLQVTFVFHPEQIVNWFMTIDFDIILFNLTSHNFSKYFYNFFFDNKMLSIFNRLSLRIPSVACTQVKNHSEFRKERKEKRDEGVKGESSIDIDSLVAR